MSTPRRHIISSHSHPGQNQNKSLQQAYNATRGIFGLACKPLESETELKH